MSSAEIEPLTAAGRDHMATDHLQKQLERAFVANPETSEPKGLDHTAPEGEAEFVLTPEGGAVMEPQDATGTSTTGKKLKAQFGRNRTHNEQVFTAPCGMIVARETFYHAEGTGAVAEMIQRVYRIEGTLPEHIFYDNNCSLAKVVKNIPWFDKKDQARSHRRILSKELQSRQSSRAHR
ncbi:hypothetical protein CC1G_13777 [Coprinopsis cinerea okayama7|uniref:Uncharacterized protein n=1 Tax=Coprinopsis cinerea (strain Okayama-7 / 130 / ATCC MYA-4618 / FGSC 9003) TaxID=240176 RepID=D6RKC4_COPC7|nr:hypothetical protein CC1G_13777 [Coprinopsis cinerea okayama7\|eukprot:XP_002912245.1 hypothetical protein CC1G_13777 [Coprinopsis cinerea okayama7\